MGVIICLGQGGLSCQNALSSFYNTPVPQSFLTHRSLVRKFIDSGHPRKTIVSHSDESDLCLSTIRSVSDMSGVNWWG